MEEELVSEIGNEFLIDGPLQRIPNCLILLLQKWGLYVLSATRSRMIKAIVFSRQNDSDSRALLGIEKISYWRLPRRKI